MHDKSPAPDLAHLGVRELTRMFADGTTTPVALVEATFHQIEAQNDAINAFSFVDKEGARVAANASTERWSVGTPLSAIDGITTTVKDVMMVKGWETTFGSHVLGSGKPSDWNSPAVARLVEAGAVLVGQTTTPEIGWKGVTDSPRHGTTRNPWDVRKTPGGSSGGAAAAAAIGAGVLHLGTDGGGSTRLPSALCGVFGHKPSHGRVPVYPPSPYSTLATAGPMARHVEDAAIMLSIISRPDVRDWHALPYENVAFEDTLGDGIDGTRIAYSPDLGHVDVDPQVASSVKAAVETLTSLSAQVEEVLSLFALPEGAMDVLWYAGIAQRLEHLDDAQCAQLDPKLLRLARKGEEISLSEYLRANLARVELGGVAKEYFRDIDHLVTPTVPMPAFDIDVPFTDKHGQRWSHDLIPFTSPFNLTKQPACSVPCGFTEEGLPIGLQIIGDSFDDQSVLKAAFSYEQVAPAHLSPAGTVN